MYTKELFSNKCLHDLLSVNVRLILLFYTLACEIFKSCKNFLGIVNPTENNKTTNTTFEPDLKQDLLNPGQDGHWLDLYPEFPENGHELP